MVRPVCSECSTPLENPRRNQKTCGKKKCRDQRYRRLAAMRKERGQNAALPDHLKDLSAVVRGETKDIGREVIKEELRPIVRESLTSDVLHSVGALVQMVPKAIERIQEDLDSPDETIRQRAYTLLLKYTMGNPSVAPGPAEAAPSPMSVVFNLPRPGSPEDSTSPVQVEDVVELQQCVECGTERPLHEFVAGSSRCVPCQKALEEKVYARFGTPDDS